MVIAISLGILELMFQASGLAYMHFILLEDANVRD